MPLIRKLAHFVALSPDEVMLLRDMQSGRQVVRRHREIVTEGRKYDALFVLFEGFAIRYRILHNGGRQILNIALPGDFIGFPGCFFESALYSATALTDTVISPIPYSRLIFRCKFRSFRQAISVQTGRRFRWKPTGRFGPKRHPVADGFWSRLWRTAAA